MVELQGLLICVPFYTAGVLLVGASISASIFVFHVGVIPLLFKYSKSFRRNLVFANFDMTNAQRNRLIQHYDIATGKKKPAKCESGWRMKGFAPSYKKERAKTAKKNHVSSKVHRPLFSDLEDPKSCGIEGARNLSIEYQSKIDNCRVKIGIWHILPKTIYESLKNNFDTNTDKKGLNKIMIEELVKSKTPIILSCHGNSNFRAAPHRIEVYKFFQRMEFHTIAFDYRGYGDSTNIKPSEPGVVEDSLVVYEWLHDIMGKDHKPPIFVWGHSLGTAISSHLLGNLPELSLTLLERTIPLPLPNGLILEAPFTNFADEVAKHPLSKVVTWLPYYEYTFVAPFRSNDEQAFKSDEHLSKTKALPILILHAKEDIIVPFILGVQLYKTILQSRSENDANIKFVAFEKEENLGHKYICHAKDLDLVVREFVMENEKKQQ